MDYSSVIDSLSQTTDNDNKEREEFMSDKPVFSREPSKDGPTLKLVLEEQESGADVGRLTRDDVKEHNTEEEGATRLSLHDVDDEEEKKKQEEDDDEDYLTEFKVK